MSKTNLNQCVPFISLGLLHLIGFTLLNKHNTTIIGYVNSKNVYNDDMKYVNELVPIRISNLSSGAFITGIDFCDTFNQSLAPLLLHNIYEYEFVVFKNQCNNEIIPANVFTNIASLFGKIVTSSDPNDKRYRIANTSITVLSNDRNMGRGGGSKNWHIDGAAYIGQTKPWKICLHQMIKHPNVSSGTQLLSSKSVLGLLKKRNPQLYDLWHRLYYYKSYMIIQPFIAKHPITHSEIITGYYGGKTTRFIEVSDNKFVEEMDQELHGKMYNATQYRNDKRIIEYNRKKSENIIKQFNEFIESDCRDNNLIYVHEYENGDLLIRDNLPLIHKSHPSATKSVHEIGTRILWRLGIEGDYLPSKYL